MNCIIGGPNVKSFAKAVQALAKIGDDLYIESLATGLVFRTVNSSRSAYVCFTFKPEFFVHYKENTNTKCKVSLKSCLMAFRSLPTMEKTVEKCLVDTSTLDCTLLIQFSCKHDLTKIYHLPFIENETVQASFKKQAFQCELTAQTRLLSDGIQNFNSAVEEVTLTVCSAQVTLKNYVDDDLEQSKVVHTEITIEAEEFENYIVQEKVDVTFCLKELKAILSFAEGFSVSVTIGCQVGGKPIVFSINGLPGLESEFVLATLAERGIQLSGTPAEGSFISGSQKESQSVTSSNRKATRISKTKGKSKVVQIPAVSVITNVPNVNDESSTAHTSQCNPIVRLQPASDQHAGVENADSSATALDQNRDIEELDVIVPSTPPKKKFRLHFLGLSTQSEYTSMLPEPDEVLVEASDEDS